MSIHEHVTTFAGRRVEDYDTTKGIYNPAGIAFALRVGWDDDTFTAKFDRLLQDPQAPQLSALVIGAWSSELYTMEDNAQLVVDALVPAATTFTGLTALFVGDVVSEECEISWIQQTNMTPLLDAYPTLTIFQVRGGDGLRFNLLRHPTLQTLIVQTGGLHPPTLSDILMGSLPNLDHLELWLGSDNYGGSTSVTDLEPLLFKSLFPRLKTLGLCDSEYADDIARRIVNAPILGQLRTLDLSKGTLTDAGAEALLHSPAIARLDTLNVSENYLTQPMLERLRRLPCRILADEQKEEDVYDGQVYRYASVTE